MENNKKIKIYYVSNDIETLSVSFFKKTEIVQVAYKKGRIIQLAAYKQGREIKRVLLNAIGDYIPNYKEAYERLGTTLKKKLPESWLKELGLWFNSKEEIEEQRKELEYLKNNFKILSLEDAGIGEYRIVEQDRVAEKQIDLSKGLEDLIK